MKIYKHKILKDVIATPYNNNTWYKVIGTKSDNSEYLSAQLIENSNDWELIKEQPFKNGDVVRIKNSIDVILLITDIENGSAYGINNGKWEVDSNFTFNINPNDWQLATSEQWLEALTKEYYKRGKFIDLVEKDVTNSCYKHDIVFSSQGNDLWVQGCGYVMINGIWAELIKEETLEELVSNGTFKLD